MKLLVKRNARSSRVSKGESESIIAVTAKVAISVESISSESLNIEVNSNESSRNYRRCSIDGAVSRVRRNKGISRRRKDRESRIRSARYSYGHFVISSAIRIIGTYDTNESQCYYNGEERSIHC